MAVAWVSLGEVVVEEGPGEREQEGCDQQQPQP